MSTSGCETQKWTAVKPQSEPRHSSKILAGMFTKRQIQQAARDRKASVKKSEAEQAEFLNSLDPAPRRAIAQAGKEIRAKRKAEGKK